MLLSEIVEPVKVAEVGGILRNTCQCDNVIDVSFVGIDQVGDRGDEVIVIVDGCSNLVQGVEQELERHQPSC